jgi:hypothetical protein
MTGGNKNKNNKVRQQFKTRVSNPVANCHKWRIGHESVVTQPTFLQLARQKNCQISYQMFYFFFY